MIKFLTSVCALAAILVGAGPTQYAHGGLKTYAFSGTLLQDTPLLGELIPGIDESTFSGTLSVDPNQSFAIPGGFLSPLNISLSIGGAPIVNWSTSTATDMVEIWAGAGAPMNFFPDSNGVMFQKNQSGDLSFQQPVVAHDPVFVTQIGIYLDTTHNLLPPPDGPFTETLNDLPDLASSTFGGPKYLDFSFHGVVPYSDPSYGGQDISGRRIGAMTSFGRVPEPSSLVLAGFGIVGLLAAAARRRRSGRD